MCNLLFSQTTENSTDYSKKDEQRITTIIESDNLIQATENSPMATTGTYKIMNIEVQYLTINQLKTVEVNRLDDKNALISIDDIGILILSKN